MCDAGVFDLEVIIVIGSIENYFLASHIFLNERLVPAVYIC